MEQVHQKYNNFIAFLNKTVKDQTYLALLSQVSIELFLDNIRKYQDKSAEEITTIICEKFGIDINEYEKTDKDIFNRYIEYFKCISQL